MYKKQWGYIYKDRLEEKQTSDNQTSDRKPSRLSFRLKELRTFACFPVSQQGGINYPPSGEPDNQTVQTARPETGKRMLFIKSIPFDSCNLQGLHGLENLIRFLLATSLLNRNPYGFPINDSPVF